MNTVVDPYRRDRILPDRLSYNSVIQKYIDYSKECLPTHSPYFVDGISVFSLKNGKGNHITVSIGENAIRINNPTKLREAQILCDYFNNLLPDSQKPFSIRRNFVSDQLDKLTMAIADKFPQYEFLDASADHITIGNENGKISISLETRVIKAEAGVPPHSQKDAQALARYLGYPLVSTQDSQFSD